MIFCYTGRLEKKLIQPGQGVYGVFLCPFHLHLLRTVSLYPVRNCYYLQSFPVCLGPNPMMMEITGQRICRLCVCANIKEISCPLLVPPTYCFLRDDTFKSTHPLDFCSRLGSSCFAVSSRALTCDTVGSKM